MTKMNLRQHGLTDTEVQAYFVLFTAAINITTTPRWEDEFVRYALRRFYSTKSNNKPLLIDTNWIPPATIVEQLIEEGIDRVFIEDQIPVFRLYWREKGMPRISYGQTFYAYIKRSWGRDRPISMNKQWQPSKHVIDILSKQFPHVDIGLAVLEFRLFWGEQNKELSAEEWNKQFKIFVKKEALAISL